MLQNGDKPILTWFSSLNIILVTINCVPIISDYTVVHIILYRWHSANS